MEGQPLGRRLPRASQSDTPIGRGGCGFWLHSVVAHAQVSPANRRADTNVSAKDETIWRVALERKGKDWVAYKLRTQCGQPGDDVLEVVYERPYPTREFCQKWCAEQENRMFSMCGHTKVVIVALLVFITVTYGQSQLGMTTDQLKTQPLGEPRPRPRYDRRAENYSRSNPRPRAVSGHRHIH